MSISEATASTRQEAQGGCQTLHKPFLSFAFNILQYNTVYMIRLCPHPRSLVFSPASSFMTAASDMTCRLSTSLTCLFRLQYQQRAGIIELCISRRVYSLYIDSDASLDVLVVSRGLGDIGGYHKSSIENRLNLLNDFRGSINSEVVTHLATFTSFEIKA